MENSCTTTATVLEDSKSPFVEEDFSGEGKFDDGPTIRLEEEEEPDMALQVNTSGEEPLNQGMLPFPSSRNLQLVHLQPLLVYMCICYITKDALVIQSAPAMCILCL